MRFITLLVFTFFAFASNAQAQTYYNPPVTPDPWRGPRTHVCVEFDRTKPKACNFNPEVIGDRLSPDCSTYRDNGGTVRILCPEDHPRYAYVQRLEVVARTCGEDSVLCYGAYFSREHDGCVYHVIPDTMPAGIYDIHVSYLPYEWRIMLFRTMDGMSYRHYQRKHARQVENAIYNATNRWQHTRECEFPEN